MSDLLPEKWEEGRETRAKMAARWEGTYQGDTVPVRKEVLHLRSSPFDLSWRSSSWESAHLQTKRKGEEQSKMEIIPTQMLFTQQEILMVRSTRVDTLISYWINYRPSLSGVLLDCWWDPELVLVLPRWLFQLRLTGRGATAATWDISLFIRNSFLETKWWETEVTLASKFTNIDNKCEPLRPLVVGSVN